MFALYPHVRTRASFMYFGMKSGWLNQHTFSGSDVHVLIAPPFNPCIATMLTTMRSEAESETTGLTRFLLAHWPDGIILGSRKYLVFLS